MEQGENVRISVRELVEFILRSGDIDHRHSALADKEAMQEGSRVHRKIQGRMGGDYRAEVPLSVTLPGEGYTLTVEGRADGIFTEEMEQGAELTYIDEIKGVYRDLAAISAPRLVHLAQAKCYAYLYGAQNPLDRVGVQMTYVSLETEGVRRFRQAFAWTELEEWFTDLTDRYRRWVEAQREWREIRQSSLKALVFPFDWRPGQKEVAASVYRAISRERNLFIQAPTGTGKTLSTVFPAVKALGEGLAERIFYATAKTVTRRVAEESFALLRKGGMRLKTLTITAKEKVCFCPEAECSPELCPYAKGHFDRVNDAVFEFLAEGEVFDRSAVLSQAEKWQVCPFEFSLDVSRWCDAVICDYNYLFDPRAKLKRFFGEGVKGEYLFLIDEAHNLVDRGREMFSASLYKEDFLALKKEVGDRSKKLSRALSRCNQWMLEKKREMEDPVKTQEDVGLFPVYLMNLSGIMEEFLEDSRDAALNQKVLELYFQVKTFLDVCDLLDENYVIYAQLCQDRRFLFRLYCVDISRNLQKCLDKGRSTVFFSATLLPIRYYKSLLSAREEEYAIYADSSFDPAKRLVLLGTDTSSRFCHRGEAEYRRMAEYVLRAIRVRRGNYLVFFSSYRMLQEVAAQFQELCSREGEEMELLTQSPGMKEQEREDFLAHFEEPHPGGLAGFCVMGGIFGEGIDLREERLIGAIVVGTGIPQICCERELLKSFYDRRGQDGFFYAYLCPGMNRVLQSAGRVIRTDQDEGVILLLDERFASRRYREMFPREWQIPPTCTLLTVEERLREFWESSRPV